MDKQRIQNAVREILIGIGEDPDREGLLDTPKRIAKMYEEIFSGMNEDAGEHLQVFFEEKGYDDVVLVKDINFHSVCEHHLVPMYGKAHVAYIPKEGKVTGLSKVARVVETVSKKPQLQERITKEIADAFCDRLDPIGVFVIVEAEHMCMTMRGVKKPGAKTLTKVARGVFEQDGEKRREIMELIQFGSR